MGDDVRALEMYEIALSLVEARGVLVSVGLTSPKEYRVESLIVRYQPKPGWLEVWSVGKVLSVKRHNEALRVHRYRPSSWEQELIAAAQSAQRK